MTAEDGSPTRASTTKAFSAAPAATARVDVFPLSFAQQRLWLLDRLVPDGSVYNVSRTLRLVGALDVTALSRALNEVIARHEVLRTHIGIEAGVPVQIIAPELPVDLEVWDLGGLPAAERVVEAERRAQAAAHTPFDLRRGPLLRASLLRLADDEHWLLLTLHHIVTDAWSSAVFGRELSALYNAHRVGAPSPLPQLSLQYADYALWQREWLQGEVLEQQLGYWMPVLAELPVLDLPTDRTRPAQADTRGGRLSFDIDATLTRGLRELARREGATLFMTLLAAFSVLLHRYSRQDDIAVGVPIAGRTRPELKQLIGFFVNTLVVRVDMRGAPTFAAHLAHVRRTTLEAFAHQDIPFEKLVEHVAPKRDLSRNPLFQVLFALQNTEPVEWDLAGVHVTRLGGLDSQTAQFDVSFRMIEFAGGLRGHVDYAVALFDSATIERMVDHYQSLLGSIVAAPGERVDRLPLQSAAERQRLLVACGRTATPYPDEACLHRLVEAIAARAAGAPALIEAERVLTYGELNTRANRLAHLLRQRAPGLAPRIGLCLERSADLVVVMLAALKAGATYVPLDPELPAERLAFILQDAEVALVVTTTALLSRVPLLGERALCIDSDAVAMAALPAQNHESAESSSRAACVLYTSGSSGRPKGVLITHQGIARLVCGTDYIHIDATDAVAHVANPAFDAATFEVWGALAQRRSSGRRFAHGRAVAAIVCRDAGAGGHHDPVTDDRPVQPDGALCAGRVPWLPYGALWW